MKANIFDIERSSFANGPGIRTTVFFKGCNLRCKWCHNPESQKAEREIMFYKNKCTSCGRCQNLTCDNTDFFCFNDAKEICGKAVTSEELLAELVKDKKFYETSGGGVTFSGGECMLQIDFLCDILKKCKEEGMHTSVDTAGCVPWEYFERVIPLTDLFLYDVKSFDDDIHKSYTGVSNKLILENLSKLLKINHPLWIRIPLVCGVNDTESEMKKIKDFISLHGSAERVELLPYHALGEHKYTALGCEAEKFASPDEETVNRFKNIFKN